MLVVGAFGAGLSYISGWEFGELPTRAYPTLTAQALRYNRTNLPSSGEILLLGSSLMRLGVLEGQLAKEIGHSGARVINLAMDGAGPWQQLRLVHRLDASRANGFKVAIIEVNRESFGIQSAARDFEIATYALTGMRSTHHAISSMATALRYAVLPPRQGVEDWVQEIRFGFLGREFPGLVPTPVAPRRRLWDVDAETQRRAVRAMTPAVASRALLGWRLSGSRLSALRQVVAELKRRGYRVVVLQTPVHSAYLAAWLRPADAVAEEAWQDSVLALSSNGADAVLAIDGAASLGTTDSVFIDYGHMDRFGASLQTQLVGKFLVDSQLLVPRSASNQQSVIELFQPAQLAVASNLDGRCWSFVSSQ